MSYELTSSTDTKREIDDNLNKIEMTKAIHHSHEPYLCSIIKIHNKYDCMAIVYRLIGV